MENIKGIMFNCDGFGDIYVFILNGEPYFIANNMATLLGYTESDKAVSQYCSNEVIHKLTNYNGKTIPTTIIPKSDVYKLIFESNLEESSYLKDFIEKIILPEVEKTTTVKEVTIINDMNPLALIGYCRGIMEELEIKLGLMCE